MASKAIIKAIPAALKAEDWKGAEDKCRSVLQFDPTNYNVNTFLGLALFRQGRVDEAEACYKEAIAVEDQKKDRKGDNPNAWSGLVNALEAQKKVDEYMEAAMKLAVIYRDLDDRTRCQTAVDKITPFVKENGSKEQYKRALRLLLPESPIFDFLEGRIPHPSLTLQKLIDIIEAEEKEKINKEIASRRSRLGVRPGQVAREVKREVLGASPLENLYHQILNWSDDEELRRTIDTKLLQHGYDKLLVVDKEEKDAERAKVYKWAEGLVILKYPFELAWKIVIEWRDCESIGEHDVNILREYIQFFPESGLSKALSAYLKSELSPFPIPAQVDEDGNPVEKEPIAEEDSPDELIDAMIEGLEKSPNSILCHRIVAEYYLTLNEYEQAIDVSRNAQKLIAAESARINVPFLKNNDAITVILATAQIHYQSPKYHPEARAAFENVLTRKTTYGAALVGLGLILEEQQNYEMAGDLLRKAFALDPENVKTRAEAAWCDVLIGKHDEGKEELERCAALVGGLDPRSRDLKAQITWRIGMAVWNGHEDLRADRKNGPYSFFITALHNNQNFAPAYTSLGIYYEDIVNDTARANKCFQKAFELSAGEVEAAERLARSFADSKEWELVEIIARRVAEADQKRSVPGKGMSWPHSAIGVVELNAQNYALAIQSFQAALRVAPNDYNAWVGLGEAYASSGKWVAATKVFVQAEKIDSSSWFPKYMLANVNRELGEYEAACAGYRAVLDLQPGEYGVLVALSETLSASAWHYVEKGYFGRAVNASVESLQVAEKVVKERPDAFNLWKTVGDCCFIFSWVQSLTEKFPKELVSRILSEDIDISEFDIMADVDGAGSNTLERVEQLDDLTACLHMGILAYKRGIYASADDRHAHAVAWFNLGCAEYRTYASLPARPMKYRHAAIRCFKRTIKLEPGNHEFWNALGVATGELNAKVAQHALVRALYINEKNARVWVNLGALYILMGDMEIANQAFSKAQSADPEYALAWVGQAVIAQMLGETQEALELYSHAFEISESSSVLVKRQFSTATFDRITKLDSSTAFSSLLGPIFALQKLQEQISSEPVSLRLNALFNERVQEFAPAAVRLEIVCNTVEQRYEETESEEDLIKYAQAKTDLARVRLGLKEYEAAVENASLALDLSGDTESLKNCRLSAHLTAGLAHYYLGAMEDSLEMFKAALTESNENPDVVCLLSQVLWAKGGDEERDVARDQLFACIEKHPDHLQSTLLLGAIGVLDNNEDVVDAVMDDLQAVCGDDKIDKTSREKVDKLLSLIGQLMKPDQNINIAGTSVFLRPFSSSTWSKLLTASPEPSYHAADMALKVAVQGKVDAEELCHAFSQVGVLSYDQKAIMVAPWKVDGWRGMVADINSANAATAAG